MYPRKQNKSHFNVNNDLIKVMYNCIDIVNGPVCSSWDKSVYTVHMCTIMKLIRDLMWQQHPWTKTQWYTKEDNRFGQSQNP